MPIYPNIYQTLLPGPIVELRGYLAACGLRGRLYAYLNYNGPTGTARDELAEGMLALALERGALTPGQTIVEAVSGPFATALTLAGLTAGHPVTLVTPEDAPAMRQESLLRLGAQIIQQQFTVGSALIHIAVLTGCADKRYFIFLIGIVRFAVHFFEVQVKFLPVGRTAILNARTHHDRRIGLLDGFPIQHEAFTFRLIQHRIDVTFIHFVGYGIRVFVIIGLTRSVLIPS